MEDRIKMNKNTYPNSFIFWSTFCTKYTWYLHLFNESAKHKGKCWQQKVWNMCKTLNLIFQISGWYETLLVEDKNEALSHRVLDLYWWKKKKKQKADKCLQMAISILRQRMLQVCTIMVFNTNIRCCFPSLQWLKERLHKVSRVCWA